MQKSKIEESSSMMSAVFLGGSCAGPGPAGPDIRGNPDGHHGQEEHADSSPRDEDVVWPGRVEHPAAKLDDGQRLDKGDGDARPGKGAESSEDVDRVRLDEFVVLANSRNSDEEQNE